MLTVNVIGAGLAGSEATYQLIKRGIKVRLYEMRPTKSTGAHKTALFSELVCSNSLRSNQITNAVGLLKEEMRLFDSLIMKAAEASQVEAGGALAVDRELFSKYITDYLKNSEMVEIVNEEVTEIPEGPTIIATGPLTSDSLSIKIKELLKQYNADSNFYFFDAIAPIIDAETIDYNKVYLKSRYDKGEASYLNCPFTKEEFDKFYDYLIHADRVIPKEYEVKVFEGCMPIEDMASRGVDTLRFGPMKPVGLRHPETLVTPYAVVQLRQDNRLKNLYNIVGFQTHLKYGAQDELMKLIPGLENAKIVRYGVMHKNTYIASPLVLNSTYQFKYRDDLFFAGQMTGVEGYVESAASGLIAGINMARFLNNEEMLDLDNICAFGALSKYISNCDINNFNPMNVNFGIFSPVEAKHKADRKQLYVDRSLNYLEKVDKH